MKPKDKWMMERIGALVLAADRGPNEERRYHETAARFRAPSALDLSQSDIADRILEALDRCRSRALDDREDFEAVELELQRALCPLLHMERGRRVAEDGETVTRYVVFNRADVEADGWNLDDPDEWFAAAQEWSGFERSVGLPGQWFWDAPSVRVSKSRMLVKQTGGYDV